MISNHPSHTMVENSLKTYDLFTYFDAVVTSAEFGKRKPDTEIFHYTLEKMGLAENNECMVCGDEYADIVGGDRAGMQTILCERIYKFPFEREIDNDLNPRYLAPQASALSKLDYQAFVIFWE